MSTIRLADTSRIQVGDTARIRKTITEALIQDFAKLSGDDNPLHTDSDFARATRFHRPIAHGLLTASYVSQLVGMRLPGPGALWVQQTFRWLAPVFVDDTLDFEARVTHVSRGTDTIKIQVTARNQMGNVVLEGDGVATVAGSRESGAKTFSLKAPL